MSFVGKIKVANFKTKEGKIESFQKNLYQINISVDKADKVYVHGPNLNTLLTTDLGKFVEEVASYLSVRTYNKPLRQLNNPEFEELAEMIAPYVGLKIAIKFTENYHSYRNFLSRYYPSLVEGFDQTVNEELSKYLKSLINVSMLDELAGKLSQIGRSYMVTTQKFLEYTRNIGKEMGQVYVNGKLDPEKLKQVLTERGVKNADVIVTTILAAGMGKKELLFYLAGLFQGYSLQERKYAPLPEDLAKKMILAYTLKKVIERKNFEVLNDK